MTTEIIIVITKTADEKMLLWEEILSRKNRIWLTWVWQSCADHLEQQDFFTPYGIGEHQIHGSFFKGVYDKSRNQDSCKYDMDQVRKKIDGNSQHAFSAALYGGDRFQCLRFSAEGSHRNIMQYQRPG